MDPKAYNYAEGHRTLNTWQRLRHDDDGVGDGDLGNNLAGTMGCLLPWKAKVRTDDEVDDTTGADR